MQKREMDLDVVRGLAIVLAMGWHFNHRDVGNTALQVILWPGATFGWTGVDMFFVLSGFLVGRLIFQEHQRTGQFDSKRFLVRRAFKLWPVLYLFLLAMLAAAPWEKFFFQIGLHVQNYFRTPVATHLWSLAVEEHFYLAFALLAPAWFSKAGALKWLFVSLAGLIVGAPVLRAVAVFLGNDPIDVQVQTQFRMDALAAGVALAALAVYRSASFERILSMRWLWVALALGGYTFLANVDKASPLGMIAGYTISYLAGGAVMLALYRTGVDVKLPRLSAALAFLGVYSYSMYIWHVPASRAVDALARKLGGVPEAVLVAGFYGASVIAAYAVARIVERPCLALRDRLFPMYASAAPRAQPA